MSLTVIKPRISKIASERRGEIVVLLPIFFMVHEI